jgi:hypothetical protein
MLLKIVHLLKVYQHIKFHSPTLTGESFASTSENLNVCHFGMVEATGLEIMASRSPLMA